MATPTDDIQGLARKLVEPLRAWFLSAIFSTYTPTYTGSGTAGTTTYGTQAGYYVRIGGLVFVLATLSWTNATGTGQVRISLPFTSASNLLFNAGAAYHEGITFANGSLTLVNVAGANTLRLFSPASNAAPTEVNIETAGVIGFFVIFQV